MPETALTPEQEASATERSRITSEIIQDSNSKKVIVAGPGTGKTYLFTEILQNAVGNKKLTLTFINALVDDLALELCGLADVRTLHSFALQAFRDGDIKIFLPLPKVIQEDYLLINGESVDFEEKIHNLDNSSGHLDFYKDRRRLYNYVSQADIVYGLVKYYEEDSDARVPSYNQILIDEFQDFNKLEVSLIHYLASKSPIVIAGDDDQVLYDELKSSNPKFIRDLHDGTAPGYSKFELPFCSRSTRVIVEAINDLIESAVTNGFLSGRIPKLYNYFPCIDKDKESAEYPKIPVKTLQENQIVSYISQEIEKIAKKKRKKFEVLVICPYAKKCETIGKALEKKGFSNVNYRKPQNHEVTYFDGVDLLTTTRVDTKASNLGWRVVSKFKLDEVTFANLIKESYENPARSFYKLLPDALKEEVLLDVANLKKIRLSEPIDPKDLKQLMENLSFDENAVKIDFLKSKLSETRTKKLLCSPGIRKISITVTTAQSSKGLAADYVFITHFEDRFRLRGGSITNQAICNVLVALTRARRKVWLLKTPGQRSSFISWIKSSKLENS